MRKLSYLTVILIAVATLSHAKSKTNYREWALRIADSEIKHNPELWMADFVKTPKWDYTQGLIAKAMMASFKATNDKKYFDYAQAYANYFINENGEIKTYKLSDYNIDRVNCGNFLFDLYDITKEEKLLKAIELLRSQLATHPRVSEGAFWHKKVYPHQVWLDGLYMGSPFYAHYATFKNESELFDDVANQFIVCDKYTRDPKTGLNFHGWDESKQQKWANPQTGQSPNFWSRSMGWYMMAMVDVLEYLPANHPKRQNIINNLNRLSKALLKYQDKKTGLWYQVTNFPGKEGNYLESSGSIMFIYAMEKGAKNKWLPAKFDKIARTSFDKFLKSAVILNADGTYSITKACAVAGLGGTPYRDGSYEYYINEPFRNDDPKVVGSFILAALEFNRKCN